MFSLIFTTGKLKETVSLMISFKMVSGISSPTNCLIASKAISSLEYCSILSIKSLDRGVVFY
jgi:precorrin-2 methylase